MPLTIVPYAREHEPAVAAFNVRGVEHGAPFELSATATPAWLPVAAGRPVVREIFLALDGAEVRGGFTLRRQRFWLDGREIDAANYQGPISEGLWDRRYMMAGVQMLRAALKDQPLLYALGMGGVEQPLPKLLGSAGWTMAPVPFRFTVLRPGRFLRHIRPLRRTRARALAMDLAAWSGIGGLAIAAAQRLRAQRRPAPRDAVAEPVTSYGAWADALWEASRSAYRFTAVRDRAAQNTLFGDGDAANVTLRCTRHGQDIGWAVVRATPMRGDRYFGDLRVGSLVDALALPGEEPAIVALATRHLRGLASDLIVTNQSHARWRAALADAGWFAAPSNFLFACSPRLADALGPLDRALPDVHVNRADGDGPIHL